MKAPLDAPRARLDEALAAPGQTLASVTQTISDIPLQHPYPRFWWTGFALAFALVLLLLTSIAWLFARGIGIWGVNVPVAWGFAIVNFVWWIGIGHAGTFISAILLLLHQQWRTSINRFTEAMTLFAVACAGLFPLLHLGRPQFFYWLLPYPDSMGLWPQFRSPLEWDVFAVSTYATVSLVFWYVGLLPDLATMRDRAATVSKARLTACSVSAGAGTPDIGSTIRNSICCSPGSRPRSSFRCTRSSASTLPSQSCRAGIRRFFPRTLSPAPSSPASRWC